MPVMIEPLLIHVGGVTVGLLAIHSLPLLALVAASCLYVRACSVLKQRGRPIARTQQACWWTGIALVAIATQTGLDTLGDQYLLTAHMAQHLLIADIPGPLLLLGLRSPVLQFLWPRPVLVTAARSRPLRSFWGWLSQPKIALTTWLVVLYAWHIPTAYEAAIAHPALHAFEHATFAFTGMLAWWPLLDPTHHRIEGRWWKAVYVVVARMVGGALGVALVVWRTPLYPTYITGARQVGLGVVSDQQWAGAMMMTVDLFVMLIGTMVFVGLTAREEELEHAAREALVAAPRELEQNARELEPTQRATLAK
jgi:cytochrome c oxidase assembly factor CtaG